MNKPFQVFSFDIRKYSVYNKKTGNDGSVIVTTDGEWYHFPQRSNISIHFFKFSSTQNINISILWNGNTMDKSNINVLNKDIVSVIARFPAIGFKQSSENGTLLKRFQISFSKEEFFDNCLNCLRNELNFHVETLNHKQKEVLKTQDALGAFPESQIAMKSPIDTSSQITGVSYQNTNPVSVDNMIFYSQDNNNLQENNFFPKKKDFRENYEFPMSQPYVNSEYNMNNFLDSMLNPIYNPIEYGQVYNGSQIPSQITFPTNLHPFTQNQNHLIENHSQDHIKHSNCLDKSPSSKIDTSNKNKKKPKVDPSDCSFYKLSDDKLKKLITEKLKNKAFINFVIRLDKIIHDDDGNKK